MKRIITLFATALLVAQAITANAQNYDDPGKYMKAINDAQADMNKVYMSYISAAWHSRRAIKIERLRQQVVESITTCRYKIIDLPIYKGDNSLRKSSIDYVWLLNKIFNDDFSHLVNMEDLVEQSYDKMELYLGFQEKIKDTLKAANDKMQQAEKDFAAKYNVTLSEDKNTTAQKMDIANNVSKYYDKVYLLFFKCVWQESQVMDAVNKKNITKLEQARSALVKYGDDGIAALDTIGNFDNDASLVGACKQALQFYKKEGENEVAKISDFLLKEETFGKIKSAYDAKPRNTRTKEDTDNYNKALDDMNAALTVANQAFKGVYAEEAKVLTNWGSVDQKFSDAHMPYYR